MLSASTDRARPTLRDAEDDASEPPQPDQAGSVKVADGSSAPVAPPPPAEKKIAPPTSSTKAIVAAGDPKRLPRPPVDKGSNPKRSCLKTSATATKGTRSVGLVLRS